MAGNWASILAAAGVSTACLLAAGCSSAPPAESGTASGGPTAASPATTASTLPVTGNLPLTDSRHRIAAIAAQQVGDGYQPNMAGPNLFDNPGLAYYAYHASGQGLPRNLEGQLNDGKPIPLADAEPGDLLFFNIEGAGAGHSMMVAILADADHMIIALPGTAAQGGGVKRIDLGQSYWVQRLIGVSRILSTATPAPTLE